MATRGPRNFKIGTVGVYRLKGRGRREDGRYYWQATARVGGKRKTLWSGWATRHEAERAVAEARAALPADLGVPEAAARQEAAAGLTVAALLDRWLSDCEARPYLAPLSLDRYRLSSDHLHAYIGALRLTEVGEIQTRGYMHHRNAAGVRLRTAWQELCVLRIAWRWGVTARLHTEPLHLPARSSIKLEKVETPRPEAAPAWAVYDALRGGSYPIWMARGYLLCLVTGARPCELWTARVGDFDAERRTVRLGRAWTDPERTKTGEREVALTADAWAELSPWLTDREPEERFVGDVTRSSFRTYGAVCLRRACQEAGVPPHSWIGLRRLTTDTMYDAGAPDAEAAMVGHSVRVAQERYRRIRPEAVREAATAAGIGRRPLPPEPEPVGAEVIPLRRREA